MESPGPDRIYSAPKRAKLPQAQAAKLIYKKLRTWEVWESGRNPMDPAFRELFLIKVKERK